MTESSESQPWKLLKRVLPQHTDHAGVMWHGAYLSWLEEARVEALADVGFPYKDLADKGFEMPVVAIQVNYLSALHHGDLVVLESRALPRRFARWPWSTKFLRSGAVVAEASVELVVVKKVGNEHRLLRKIPDQIVNTLLKLQFGPSDLR